MTVLEHSQSRHFTYEEVKQTLGTFILGVSLS